MENGLYFDTDGFYQVENNEVEQSFPKALPMVDTILEVEKDGQGRINKWTETRTFKVCVGHPKSGERVSKRQDDYTYYGTGEVDIVDQKDLDENDEVEHQKEIKHYKDGRQPKVKIIK